MGRIRFYTEFTDDFEKPSKQVHLPDDYAYVRKGFFARILSPLTYGAALLFSLFYCRLHLHMKIYGKKGIRKAIKNGAFIYGNHTQPIGDVVIPARAVFPKRIYTVVSPANYAIPVIGKVLPYLGALPTAETVSGTKELLKAIKLRISQKKCVVIYPEAHVWKYYTGIRPFADTSFKFPVKFKTPAIAMTVTYKKSRIFKKPLTHVYLDGPFYPPDGVTETEKVRELHRAVRTAMESRSRQSNFEYIKYVKK